MVSIQETIINRQTEAKTAEAEAIQATIEQRQTERDKVERGRRLTKIGHAITSVFKAPGNFVKRLGSERLEQKRAEFELRSAWTEQVTRLLETDPAVKEAQEKCAFTLFSLETGTGLKPAAINNLLDHKGSQGTQKGVEFPLSDGTIFTTEADNGINSSYGLPDICAASIQEPHQPSVAVDDALEDKLRIPVAAQLPDDIANPSEKTNFSSAEVTPEMVEDYLANIAKRTEHIKGAYDFWGSLTTDSITRANNLVASDAHIPTPSEMIDYRTAASATVVGAIDLLRIAEQGGLPVTYTAPSKYSQDTYYEVRSSPLELDALHESSVQLHCSKGGTPLSAVITTTHDGGYSGSCVGAEANDLFYTRMHLDKVTAIVEDAKSMIVAASKSRDRR